MFENINRAYENFIHRLTAVIDNLTRFNANKNGLKDWFNNEIVEKYSKIYLTLGFARLIFPNYYFKVFVTQSLLTHFV